ncbi:MAG: TM0106 family RecB-like putative nuclease, partial [Chloroflexota bacterium]|nr:TM0106 family RecB-like putative nuclease [Chloroflexota bacterium]
LVERGVITLAGLGTLTLPMDPKLEGTSPESLKRVREQARLQAQGRREGRILHELLQPIEAGRGLAALPPPSPGDLFFDMEGDPFVEEGGADGLEYLFGVIEPAGGMVDAPAFHAFWGLDRAGEKRAFEQFIDLVMDRLRKDPDLHVYHYAAYEPSAVKRLMGRHATREEEVDRLLRGDVFVDLYSVVRQGVRVSQDSYSIKKLEPLYGLIREVALKDAGSSIVNFERWLDGGGTDQALLEQIREYNRDDCVSTLRLRDWLEERRVQAERDFGVAVPRPEPQDNAPSEDLTRDRAEVEALVERLTADLPPDGERSVEEQATWLLAQLLDWHRREDKSTWWEFFHRMEEMTEEELIEDRGPIARLTYEGIVGVEKQSSIHRYRFPKQDHEIRAGMEVFDPATKKGPGTVESVDDATSTVDLKRGTKSTVPHPTSLVPLQLYRAAAQHGSLMRIGRWVAENSIDAPGPYRAARDLLMRSLPRAGQEVSEPLAEHGDDLVETAVRLANHLDSSVLPIQGPPGSGKTFTGARMIAGLVAQGKQVGITANSHKVIGNLLKGIFEAGEERGVTVTAMQKADKDQSWDPDVALCTGSNEVLAGALAVREAMVGAGTAWVWARDEFKELVDVLFVDEAGQMSLANVVAVAAAAKSVVLLGDPAQLEQPVKGSHPPGAEVSALEHLLNGAQTMPPERGLFLKKTWRLHPDLCRFTSEVFYEGRLEPERHLALQDIDAPGGELTGTGLRWVPVAHEGNQNASVEEAR